MPTRAEYKTLEDYLFRAIAREAGAQKLAVQIHVLETFGGFYSPRGSAPHLLEPAFNDSTLRATKFVIVHGGWPLVGETQALLSKPNVYADISMMDNILSPTVLAGVLRQWLGEWPDKVLFGTDAFDGGAEQGWEQIAWVGIDDDAPRAGDRAHRHDARRRDHARSRRRRSRGWCCARTPPRSTACRSSM